MLPLDEAWRAVAAKAGSTTALTIAIWGAVIVSGLVYRPLLPVDETRYLSVAWEMWLRGDLLVPHLNGVPYAHKPPLVFWIINLVWFVTGVSQTAARLVPAAFALASAAAVAWMARGLWPGRTRVAAGAPLALLGFPVFALCGSLVLFDVPLAFFVLLALGAVVQAARGGSAGMWGLYAVALGAALLTKGPVALVFVLPPVLLAPLWWEPGSGMTRREWYGRAALASAGGIALALAWALPAAAAGGVEYAHAILWDQTTRRIADSFAHARPWWFYLALLPVVLYPWSLMPSAWRGLVGAAARDSGVRFCFTAILPGVAILSAISGKQPHYLVPLLPIAGLLVAAQLDRWRDGVTVADTMLPLCPIVAIGLAVMFAPALMDLVPRIAPHVRLPAWIVDIPAAAGAVLVAGSVACAAAARRGISHSMLPIAAGSAFLIFAVNAIGGATVFGLYDLRAVSRYLGAHQDVALAYNKDYEGEFGFLGRLRRDIVRVNDDHMADWMRTHAGARVIVRYVRPPAYVSGAPEFEQPYRGQRLGIWVVPPAPAQSVASVHHRPGHDSVEKDRPTGQVRDIRAHSKAVDYR